MKVKQIIGFLEKATKLRKKSFVELTKKDVKELRRPKRKVKIKPERTAEGHEVEGFKREVAVSGPKKFKSKKEKVGKREVLPTRVSKFDELIGVGGLESGSTILVSGGCGTGKTTFCLQSLYNSALNGEKGVYISLEEDVSKVKKHMLNNFGWDFFALEEKGLVTFLKWDPIEIARTVEALILKQKEKLVIEFGTLELPLKPDRIVIDSLSALAIAFENTDCYRKYIRYLFERFEEYNSVNFVISETEQDPKVYSRAGIEEFLADGVIVLYNIQIKNVRENALEILKLRSSKHVKRIVPFELTPKGMEVYPAQEIFREF